MKYFASILVLSLILFACKTGNRSKLGNSVFTISPYKSDGAWVFDDSKKDLEQEPFVSGIPEMIELITADIPDAENGFVVFFSSKPFPGYQLLLKWTSEESDGNWYIDEKTGMEGWLCPALLKYFRKAPKTIYIKTEAKK
jgi:hypothetical protein